MVNDELTLENQTTTTTPEPNTAVEDSNLFDKAFDEAEKSTTETEEGTEPKPDIVQKPVTKTEPKEGESVVPTPGTTTEPEKKPGEGETVKPEAVKPEAVKPEPKPDTEVDAIAPPSKLSEKGKQGWDALKGIATTRLEKLTAAEAKIAELAPQVGKPDPKIVEENTTLKQELAKYQLLFQNERSPEFAEKYDKRIEANDTNAYAILERRGLPKEQIEQIKKMGGLTAIPDEKITEWYNVIAKVSATDAQGLLKAIDGNKDLRDQRDKAIEEIKAKPEQFIAQQQETKTKEFQNYTKEMADYVTETTKDLPWCKMQEVPSDATPEVKARIEKENKFYQESEARFQAMLYPKDAKTRAQTALAACLSFKLADDNAQLQTVAKHWYEEAQKLQTRIDSIQKAGVTSRAGTTIPTGGPKGKLDLSGMTDDDAIEAQMTASGL